jgi:hypothetical protein
MHKKSAPEKATGAASTRFLDNIMIAAPCTADWDNMEGDDTVRFCNLCELNVFNLSGMSGKDAEALLRSKSADTNSSLCIALYRRADGTIITDNCPVGLRKIRNRMLKLKENGSVLARIAAGLALFVLGLPAEAQDNPNVMMRGDVALPQQKSGPEQGKPNPVSSSPTLGEPTVAPAVESGKPKMRFGAVPMPYLPELPRTTSTTRPTADRAALNFYNEAKRYDAAGKFILAETSFKEAIKAASKEKHDPKFREKIKKDYADFLRKHNRSKEAAELAK